MHWTSRPCEAVPRTKARHTVLWSSCQASRDEVKCSHMSALRSAQQSSVAPRLCGRTPMAAMIPTSLGALAALRLPMTGHSTNLAYCSAPASPAGRDGALLLRSPAGSDPGSGEERGDLSNLHSRLLKRFEVSDSSGQICNASQCP